ncbi:hypothetical protein M0N37_20095, partial [Aeromonas taiwanensis]
RVDSVNEWHSQGDRKSKHKQVCIDEVGGELTHFDDLYNVFAQGLTEGAATKATTVPATSPPRAVRLVVLEFTRNDNAGEELENGTLDS